MTPMTRLAAAWVVVLTGGFAAAQPPTLRVYSQPLPPPETAAVAATIARERAGAPGPGEGGASFDRGPIRSSGTFGTGSVREAGVAGDLGVQPILVWDFVTGLRLEMAPLLTREFVLA